MGKASRLPEDLLTKTTGGVDLTKAAHLKRRRRKKKRKKRK